MPNCLDVDIDTTKKVNWSTSILLTLFGGLLSFAGTYYSFVSSKDVNMTEQFKTFMETQQLVNAVTVKERDEVKAELRQVKEDYDVKISLLVKDLEKRDEEAIEWRDLYLEEKLNSFKKDLQLMKVVTETEMFFIFSESMPFGSWIKCKENEDDTFKFVALNDRFTSMFGLTKNSAMGKDDYEVFPNFPELARAYQEGDLQVALSGKPLMSVIDVPTYRGELIKSDYVKFRMPMDNPKFSIDTSKEKLCVGGLIINKQFF